MTRYDMGRLMGEIDEGFILEALESCGMETGRAKAVPAGGRARKLFRTALIAVLLSGAFITAAYAAGWFGLDDFKIGEWGGNDVLAIQGYGESVELAAAKELYDYTRAHPFDPETADEELSAKLAAEHGGYGVYTKEGWDMVFSLCDKYALRTLGPMTVPEGEKAFCETAGIGRLCTENAGARSIYGGGYISEDGSFSMQGNIDGGEGMMMFDFRRSMKGTLGYVIAPADEGCVEWDYMCGQGLSLHLAQGERNCYILLDGGDAFYFVNILLQGCKLGDKGLERLADCFDWLALSDADRGMDGDFTPVELTPHSNEELPVPIGGMEDYAPMKKSENIGSETEPDYIYHHYEIGEISAARLYVKSLDKYFGLDAARISLLETTLADGLPGSHAGVELETADSLLVDLKDGRKCLFYTQGNSFRTADTEYANGLSYSMYELFDVPLETQGRSEAEGLVSYCVDYEYGRIEYDYEPGGRAIERRVQVRGHGDEGFRTLRYVYDEDGRLQKQLWYDRDRLSSTISYTYDEAGRRLTAKTETDRIWTLEEYIYDRQGRLSLTKVYDEQHPEGNKVAWLRYEYDELGRCRVKLGG